MSSSQELGLEVQIKYFKKKEKLSHISTTPMLTVASYWKNVLESLTTFPALFFYFVQYGYSHDYILFFFRVL